MVVWGTLSGHEGQAVGHSNRKRGTANLQCADFYLSKIRRHVIGRKVAANVVLLCRGEGRNR